MQVPLYSKGGELVGHRTVHNERLTTFMLQNLAAQGFGGLRRHLGAKGDNAIDRMELNRLRRRWRAEWQREWEAEREAEEQRETGEIVAALDAKLGGMRESWLKSMSPRVRALYRTYEEVERDEREDRAAAAELPLLPGVLWPEQARGESEETAEAEWEELIELEKRGIEPIPPLGHSSKDRAEAPGARVAVRGRCTIIGWRTGGLLMSRTLG